MKEAMSKSIVLVLFCLLLFVSFSSRATACPPPCPDCYYWDDYERECVWACGSNICCGGECCNPDNCCLGEECCGSKCCNGVCCDVDRPCCNGVCCDSGYCCGGDICCEGKKCCTQPDPYCCETDETCCDGTCCDSATKKCCDDIGGQGDGYCCDANEICCEGNCCDPDCEFCCSGTCCDETNCEICKNDNCIRAVPTNFHQTHAEDLGNGVLYFEYGWDSTTGDVADLGNCHVGEKVDYPDGNPYYFPSPPWSGGTPNPVLGSMPATWGGCSDTQSPPPFKKPYQAASFTATQIQQYHCGPDCCMGDVSDRSNWETLLSIGSIIRVVSSDGPYWRYSITKSGEYAEIFPLP